MEMNYSYRGNPLLKRQGVQIEWTAELIQEFQRCKEDPIYFCEKYMKIVHVDKGLIPFDLFDYQKDMILSMIENRYSIFACARQSGKSTIVCGFVLHYIIFNSDKTIAILANKAATAMEILGRVQKAYLNLPNWLQQGVVEWNKGSMVLENGSRAIGAATSSDSIRGFSINCLFLDETAFIENFDEFYTSTYPTISSGKETKIVMVSTPKGLNHFHKFWVEAERGLNGFNPIKVTWDQVPGRDAEWQKNTLNGLNNDLERFAQEYEVSFLGSSSTLISGKVLKDLIHQLPISQEEGLYVYETPVKDHIYTMTCDVSRGKGLDYSAFSIVDITEMPYKQVCVYKNNLISPAEYADVIFRIGTWYNEAAVLVENNDLGPEVTNILFNNEYGNLLYTENGGAKGKRIAISLRGAEIGIRTSTATKAKGCAVLKLLVEQQQFIVNDANTIHELSRFVRDKNSYKAEEGGHDDLVMTLVLFAWLSAQDYFKELTDINTMAELRERSKQEMEEQMAMMGLFTYEEEVEEDVVDVSYDDFLSILSS
jgi:hypothetical protein